MRVILTAFALCALSFVAGVAGDLSGPANAGQAVTLRIPPPIPADAPRAAPMRPLVATSTAVAAQPREVTRAAPEPLARAADESSREAKPRAAHRMLIVLPKVDEAAFAKAKQRKQG